MEIKERLLELGFMTGSYFYGTNKDESDFDICIPITKKQKALDIIGDLEITPSEYNGGCYINDSGLKINCIFLHPNEVDGWKVASCAIKEILSISTMPKRAKCRLFEIIKSAFLLSEATLLKEEYDEEDDEEDFFS